MGKFIETNHSDVQKRIIKRPVHKTKPQLEGPESLNDKPHQLKRKVPSITDLDEPAPKISRYSKENENSTPEEKSRALLRTLREAQNQIRVLNHKISTITGNNPDELRLNLKENDARDLFFDDEKRSNYENYVNKDFNYHIIDEISLEGLDGITIEALWKRLLIGLETPILIDNDMKEVIWQLVCRNEDVKFYKLPEPRGVLDIHNRFKHFNTDIGVVMETVYRMPDIYPHALVTDAMTQGSCSTFKTRSEISSQVRNLTLKDAEERYGRSLVIVASHELRRRAILYDTVDPNVELQNMEYCILERIGRSRRHGELTQGNMSITADLKMPSKTFFHYKKQLAQHDLLGKQSFYIKSLLTDQNKMGRLLHLKRFYHIMKPKQVMLTEQIVNLIRMSPNNRLEYSELRKIYADSDLIRRAYKSSLFQKFVKTSIYPYRAFYPNAKKYEYMRKAKPVEKGIRCLELRNPYVNLSAHWNTNQEDSDKEDDDDEECYTGRKIFNMECFREVYYHIYSKREEGCSTQDLCKLVDVDFKTIRMTLKKLVTKNMIDLKKHDRGKQRSFVYYARHLENPNTLTQNTEDEPKPSGSVISKIKARQKAAREKLGQNVKQTEENILESPTSFPKIDFVSPSWNCEFLIKKISDSCLPFYKIEPKARFINTLSIELTLKLNTKHLHTIQSFNINELLNLITETIVSSRLKANINDFYTVKMDTTNVTKLILLKALLEEVVITAEALEDVSRKRKRPIKVSLPISKDNIANLIDKGLQYMGSDPIKVFNEKDGNVRAEIFVSTPPETYRYDTAYPERKELSERVLSRIRLILGWVYEKKVFEEIPKMLKFIQEEESKEGYEKKPDRKSLQRLLQRLVTEGYVRVYHLIITDGKITKSQLFVCHPDVLHTNSTIQSAYQQLKWKYFVGNHKKAIKPYIPPAKDVVEVTPKEKASPFTESDVMVSIADVREMNRMKFVQLKSKYNRTIGKTYGFKPKFIRMRILHEFMFYLVYCYDKNTTPLENAQVKDLFDSYRIDLTDVDLNDMPKTYCKEISWKMFIPPLPTHKGWNEGWALVCDIILRLPISVLCKVHNITFDIPDLFEILNHPIKRFYLVKDLPESIRTAALFKRKYLFDIHSIMSRLAYCGLLQFGPQKYKEKDQVFIYLNRSASLLDTTTSEPFYHKVADKEYKQLKFYFNTQNDLDDYWYNLYGISLSTKLNAKQPGQLVTLIDITAKPELMRTIRATTQEDAIKYDNGDIPGDKRGAAGLDSSLWAHIMRNWFWGNCKPSKTYESSAAALGLRKEKLNKILPRNLPFNELQTTSVLSYKVYLPSNKEKKETKLKISKKMYKHYPTKTSKMTQKIVRRIQPRWKPGRKQYYDHVDKMILKRIGVKTRVKWSEQECKALMLCKAGCMLLYPDSIKQVVPYSTLRDVLHRACPEAKNKTSRACQRRVKFHLDRDFRNLQDNFLSLLKIEPIAKYFSPLINRLADKETDKPFKLTEPQINVAYIILMSYVFQHQDEVLGVLQGAAVSVDPLKGQNLKDLEKDLEDVEEQALKFKDPKSEEDIKKEVLKIVIHSSLEYKSGSVFQLFKIYQKYSDNLIRQAIVEIKHAQMISLKKLTTKKSKLRWHTPFQLSNIFIYSQATTFDETTAVKAFKVFQKVKDREKFLDFAHETLDAMKYGQMIGLNEFFTVWDRLNWKFFLPQNTVILNPEFDDHSELVRELAIRWQMTLKKRSQESMDIELEQQETENYRQKSGESGATTSQTLTKSAEQANSEDSKLNPLDLSVETGSLETIDRLKTWVTDCMDHERERRSPSPEFMEEEVSGSRDCDVRVKKEYANVYDNETVQPTSSKTTNREEIPTLEEIEAGMMQETSQNEKRSIPYITDLSSLLNRDTFGDMAIEESKLERLKTHFVTQYAVLDDVSIEDPESLHDSHIVEYIEDFKKNKEVWDKLKSAMVIKLPREKLVYEALNDVNYRIVDHIIEFVKSKRELGATASEIKAHFDPWNKIFTLEKILPVLLKYGVLLRTGVCTITFVHFSFQVYWLVETFALTQDEQELLEEKTADKKQNVNENLNKQLEEKSLIMVKMMPWTKVDGTLNYESAKTWLCNIVSHCLDYPNIPFMNLCEKFCFVRPVDIFFLCEILEELGCLRVYVYDIKEPDLFSEWEEPVERKATFLDNFNDMYVMPNNISMTRLGSFFHDCEE